MPKSDKQEILNAISGLGNRMDGLETRQNEMLEMMHAFAEGVEERFTSIDKRFDAVDKRFERIEKEQIQMRSVMATKDYIDRKLFDFKGDIVTALQKGDQHVKALVGTLKHKRILTAKESENILSRSALASSHS